MKENLILPEYKAVFKLGLSSHEQLHEFLCENPQITGIAMLGRSNVGKSSLINAIFGRQTARVSKTPGRTREINVFEIECDDFKSMNAPPVYLFDLPGYGHAEISKSMAKNWGLLIDTFFTALSRQVYLINIQDARHPDQSADQQFHQYLRNFDFQTILVFNKMDKLKNQKERNELDKVKPQLLKKYKWVKQVHFVSAETKTGVGPLHLAFHTFLLKKLQALLN